MSAIRFHPRPPGDVEALPATLPPLLRRLYASRGVRAEELSLELARLLPPQMKGLDAAATLLHQAIDAGRHIVIAGDYDADGATATALAVLGLRRLGATRVSYVVPDRFRMGYGLSPALAELAAAQGAELLVTVDNGIASLAGVARAQALGMQVLITDHHLPGPELPAAEVIVNPNQPGCPFGSRHLAGVGVMFYVLMALRARLREAGRYAQDAEPALAEWLDLVALGTVADVVRLDANNRILVAQGLRRIQAARCRPGILALLDVAGRSPERISSLDLGFVLGPRINAAGRLDDIRIGIECLLADSLEQARPLAQALDAYNRERRSIESGMRAEAEALSADLSADGAALCLFDPGWHEGVVGLVASRIKDQCHRPVIAFARAQEPGQLKGSGRTIPGLHLRDALAAVDARHPGLITRFGGHAMAAGLSLPETALPAFSAAFEAICQAWLSPADREQRLEHDGTLAADELSLDAARELETAGPWGQGFPEPLFWGRFVVLDCRLLGAEQQHARYRLRGEVGAALSAIHFNAGSAARAGETIEAVYRCGINRYQGRETLELQIVQLAERAQ